MDSLPLDLLDEILYRINPRSLVMMQCTNKSLHSHISNDKYFKSEYFSRLGSGLLLSPQHGKSICYHSLDDPKSPRTIFASVMSRILGSCSGLLLLFLDGLCVVNPLTKEFRFLSQPRSWPNRELPLPRRDMYIGFAVDQVVRNTQSFKIVCLTEEVKKLEEASQTTYRFEIYILDSWIFSETKIACGTSDLDQRMKRPVYLDGSLHWLRKDGSIVAFNPETEHAKLIPTKFPKELTSLEALFAADDKRLTLISTTREVVYVYVLENNLTDPKWVLERRIRNVVVDEKRLLRWEVLAYDGMCLVLCIVSKDPYVRMLHGYYLRADKWGLMGPIKGWCDANLDSFQFRPSSSYVIGLHEKKKRILASDAQRISTVRSIMGLVNDGILSKIMEKQSRIISVGKDKKKPILSKSLSKFSDVENSSSKRRRKE